MKYNPKTDRLEGHSGPQATLGSGWPAFELDEWELGARAALALDDDDQWWWELYG